MSFQAFSCRLSRIIKMRTGFIFFVCAASALAQQEIQPRLSKDVRAYIAFEKLPANVQTLIDSAVNHYDEGDYEQPLKILERLLTGAKVYKLKKAWLYHWLSLTNFVSDSLEAAEKYVTLSLEEDLEIWREYADPRLKFELRQLYQEQWEEIQREFNKKRYSWRFGLGTITRADFSRRSGFFDIYAGIQLPTVKVSNDKIEFDVADHPLFIVGLQRLRKSIERLTAGVFLESSLELKKNLSTSDLDLSPGLITSYTYKSGWEFGYSFEITITSRRPNFEFYVRKWFK